MSALQCLPNELICNCLDRSPAGEDEGEALRRNFLWTRGKNYSWSIVKNEQEKIYAIISNQKESPQNISSSTRSSSLTRLVDIDHTELAHLSGQAHPNERGWPYIWLFASTTALIYKKPFLRNVEFLSEDYTIWIAADRCNHQTQVGKSVECRNQCASAAADRVRDQRFKHHHS